MENGLKNLSLQWSFSKNYWQLTSDCEQHTTLKNGNKVHYTWWLSAYDDKNLSVNVIQQNKKSVNI